MNRVGDPLEFDNTRCLSYIYIYIYKLEDVNLSTSEAYLY